MKTFFLTTMIALFLLLRTNGMRAQTLQTQLDQLKLAQAFFVGTLQRNIGKDTTEVSETQQYGNAFVSNVYLVINGKKSFRYADNYGFSSKDGKFKGFNLMPNGGYATWIGLFISEEKFCADFVQNFDPEKVLRKIEMVFDTPTNITVTFFNSDGIKTGEVKYSKVK